MGGMLATVEMKTDVIEHTPKSEAVKTAIIVSDSSRIVESLRAVLKSIADLVVIDTASDSALGIMMVRENNPDLIFLNFTRSIESSTDFINTIKQETSSSKCIALVEDINQIRKARKAGADGILLRGFSLAELHQQIKNL